MSAITGQYPETTLDRHRASRAEFRGGATKLRFGRRNFVAKLPRNSAPGYGSASVFASVFTGLSPIFAQAYLIWLSGAVLLLTHALVIYDGVFIALQTLGAVLDLTVLVFRAWLVLP